MPRSALLLSLAILAGGCRKRAWIDAQEDAQQQVVLDTSRWDGAVLDLLSPVSGAFLPLGEPAEFAADLVTADGVNSGWADIAWTSDRDDDWILRGDRVEDDSLSAGIHTITAEAELPNGDRVAWSSGGVIVQHPDAGLYVGRTKVEVTMDYQGTALTTACIGPVTLVIEPEGDVAGGFGGCEIALMDQQIDMEYDFDLEVEDGDLRGSATSDLYGYLALDFDVEGMVLDGAVSAWWEGSALGFADFAGTIEAERISRNTETTD